MRMFDKTIPQKGETHMFIKIPRNQGISDSAIYRQSSIQCHQGNIITGIRNKAYERENTKKIIIPISRKNRFNYRSISNRALERKEISVFARTKYSLSFLIENFSARFLV